jgi:hypothetical protein
VCEEAEAGGLGKSKPCHRGQMAVLSGSQGEGAGPDLASQALHGFHLLQDSWAPLCMSPDLQMPCAHICECSLGFSLLWGVGTWPGSSNTEDMEEEEVSFGSAGTQEQAASQSLGNLGQAGLWEP